MPAAPALPRSRALALAALVLGAGGAAGQAPSPAGAPMLFRQPALGPAEICFAFGGDLWLVPRAGGTARRLTTQPGTASDCHFSPDGRWVAFTNTRNGNPDVYVVAAAGGEPHRLTWHPGRDMARGWTPDGKVLFASDRASITPFRTPRLYVQAPDAVTATPVDLPSGTDGSFSPDGRRMAYMPIEPANAIWKRYRGGRTTPIWIVGMADAAVTPVPRENSTDSYPMWVGDTVFFLSDRDGPTTLYSYAVGGGAVRRRVENHGLDIKSASAGPGGIVYEQFGTIHLYDLARGGDAVVPIRLAGELAGAEPHWVSVGDRLEHAALSPTGVRAAFEARGEIITVPAKKGDWRNVTRTTAATERWPAWSPDGQTLAYLSDAGGGYHLELRPQNGRGAARVIALGGDDDYYYQPVWSPDARHVALSDSRARVLLVEVATGRVTVVDQDPIGAQFGEGGIPAAWSPDSRWLAYPRSLGNRLSGIFVRDVAGGTSTLVTDAMTDARSPAFDASGKYLYFVASTDAGPASDFSMMTFDHPVTRSLYAVVLRQDLPSPMAPESDEERAREEKAATDSVRRGARRDSTATPAPATRVQIDLAGIEQRAVALPVPARNYVAVVTTAKPGVVVLGEAPIVPVDQQGGDADVGTLLRFSLEDRKLEPVADGITAFDVSRDGEKVLYRRKDSWTSAPLAGAKGPPAAAGESGVLQTGDIQVATDPRAEWREMYHEAFRLQRAFFYDPSYHGLDLAATERYYARWLDGLGSRADLDYLFQEVFGNLTVGHLFVGPSRDANPRRVPRNGLLGADYAADHGRWRIARVYAGENWNPDLRAPLTQPGVNVRAGEYLLAVDGRDLTTAASVDQALEGTAGRAVVLRVGPTPDGKGARDVTAVPLPSETMLRHLAWIDENRRTVDRLSGGKLAYIYVPNTANEGYTRFNRYFFAQQDRRGAVVDERYNGGGNIADYMIEYLRREAPFNYVTTRHGVDVPVPAGAIYGPKVMLVNEYAGSGGDELPWLFHRFRVGQIVGKRTWGGLVGIGGYPALMDGGTVTAPRGALWSAEGEYAVENRGVAPDVEVELEPAAWRAGHDTQLERGVAILMQEIGSTPASSPKRPPFPMWAKGHPVGDAPAATTSGGTGSGSAP